MPTEPVISLYVTPALGVDIRDVIRSMIHVATVNRIQVISNFNGYKLYVDELTDVETTYEKYNTYLRRIQ